MMFDNIIYDDGKKKIELSDLYIVDNNANFVISIVNGCFSGKANFCMCFEHIQEICSELSEMYTMLCGNVCICDEDGGAYINFMFKEKENLIVNGRLGEFEKNNCLIYEFRVDYGTLIVMKQELGRITSLILEMK